MKRNADQLLREQALQRFADLVGSVGVKRFATEMGLSTRQINRILSGAQPNPIERVIRAVQCADAEIGDGVLDFICQEMGGRFVRDVPGDPPAAKCDRDLAGAAHECAAALAAVREGTIGEAELKQIRERVDTLASIIGSSAGSKGA